jgi:hypothetical protein
MQKQASEAIGLALDIYQEVRDEMTERCFFGVYGSPVLQTWLELADAAQAAAQSSEGRRLAPASSRPAAPLT